MKNCKKKGQPSLGLGCISVMKVIPVVRGHAYSDDHWLVNCPNCGRGRQWEGYFDPEDIYRCILCGQKFRCERIVFNDGSFIAYRKNERQGMKKGKRGQERS